MRSPQLKKDEPCITCERCVWSNIIKQELRLDFKYQGSHPDSAFNLVHNFEQFDPFPDATDYPSHLFLLIFPVAIVILGKGLSITEGLHNGSLQKYSIPRPSLKIASLKTTRLLHWSQQQSRLPIISSVCILLKCLVSINTVFKSTNNKLFILIYKVVSIYHRQSTSTQIRMLQEKKKPKINQIRFSLYYNRNYFPIHISQSGNLFPKIPKKRDKPCRPRKPLKPIKESAFKENISLIASLH